MNTPLIVNLSASKHLQPLMITNQGSRITKTNYWDHEMQRKGLFYLSGNAGAFRLLVPSGSELSVFEMLTGKEVIITKGYHRELRREMLEVLFDDGSEAPFVIMLSEEQTDVRVADVDSFTQQRIKPAPFEFLVYTKNCNLAARFQGRWRRALLPCVAPWGKASKLK